MTTFGNRLRELRLKNHMKQEELAQIINKTKDNISKYEHNKRQADDETKKQLAKYFNVSMDYLFGLTDNPTPINQPKQEKSINEDLDSLINKLKSDKDYIYNGQKLDNSSRNLIIKSLEHTKDLVNDMITK